MNENVCNFVMQTASFVIVLMHLSVCCGGALFGPIST